MSHLAQPSNLDDETAPRGIVSIGRQRLPWQWEPPGSPNSAQTPRYFGIEQFLPGEHARRIIAGIDISGGTAGSEHGATVGMAWLARGSMAVVGRTRPSAAPADRLAQPDPFPSVVKSLHRPWLFSTNQRSLGRHAHRPIKSHPAALI